MLDVPKEDGHYWAKVKCAIPAAPDSDDDEFIISEEWEPVQVQWGDNWGLTEYKPSVTALGSSESPEILEWGEKIERKVKQD